VPAAKGKKGKSAEKAAGRSPARAPGKAAARTVARRADFGAPIDAFFEEQPEHLRAILVELRRLVEEAAPDAQSSIKWGMPWFSVGGRMFCSLGGHKAHVNLILAGPPEIFRDPGGLLSGTGSTGRHLKIASLDELPREAVRGWLRTAAALAKEG